MKFKIDENLPAEIRDDLRAMGHDAELVSDEGLTGSPDEVLLEHMRREKRAVPTLDTGIADVRAHPPDRYHGIIVFLPAASVRPGVFARLPIPEGTGVARDRRIAVR